MAGSEISISATDGGSFTAYVAKPASGTGPAVLVIQEVFGINDAMRAICDEMAAAGYVAVCPDLFWRQEPGVQLTDKTEEHWARAMELFQGFDLDKGVDDLKATLGRMRTMPEITGRIGCMGYCLGGRLAFLMAARSDVDASVSYYGVYLQEHLHEIDGIAKPYMLHAAEEDAFVPKEAAKQVAEALARNPNATVHSYPGMDHAFARPGGIGYDKENAELANRRTREFFKQHLG